MNIADTLQRDAREIVFIARRKLEQRRGRAVVVNDAAAIGIHPAELERGFGAPSRGGITIQVPRRPSRPSADPRHARRPVRATASEPGDGTPAVRERSR